MYTYCTAYATAVWLYDTQREPVWLFAVTHESCVRLVLYYSTCCASPSV